MKITYSLGDTERWRLESRTGYKLASAPKLETLSLLKLSKIRKPIIVNICHLPDFELFSNLYNKSV